MFYLIAIIIYIDFLSAIKITKLETTEITNTTNIDASLLNNTQITNQIKQCSIKNCLKCDPALFDICIECNKDFELYDNKCLSKIRLFCNCLLNKLN